MLTSDATRWGKRLATVYLVFMRSLASALKIGSQEGLRGPRLFLECPVLYGKGWEDIESLTLSSSPADQERVDKWARVRDKRRTVW